MDDKRTSQFLILAGVLLLNALAQETVRLVEGPNAREGRVEVFFSGIWSLVCGAGWDMLDAEVVCQSLGYGGASTYRVNLTIADQANNTVWLSGVRCIGNETSLSKCANDGWGENTCAEDRAAGVTCFDQARPQFISSGLDTIIVKYQPVRLTDVSYTVQVWLNTSAEWLDTRCRQSIVKNTCVVTNLSGIVTLTGLSPGHAYFVRFASSTQEFSQVSEPMETKKLDFPLQPRIVSSSSYSITLKWVSTNSVITNYTVEVKCCEETKWTEARCWESLIAQGCTLNDTTAVVIGLKPNKEYYFRVYAVYKNFKGAVSSSSGAVRTKTKGKLFSAYQIWMSSQKPRCIRSQTGHVITLFCHVPDNKITLFKWTKGGRVLCNGSCSGILNVSISSSEDFGVYTCHAVNKYGATNYNIRVCQSLTDHVEMAKEDYNHVAIAVITTCFICFAIFIVVLILLKMARIRHQRKKQSLNKATGREEIAMLHYRQKMSRSGNNNEEDLE